MVFAFSQPARPGSGRRANTSCTTGVNGATWQVGVVHDLEDAVHDLVDDHIASDGVVDAADHAGHRQGGQQLLGVGLVVQLWRFLSGT